MIISSEVFFCITHFFVPVRTESEAAPIWPSEHSCFGEGVVHVAALSSHQVHLYSVRKAWSVFVISVIDKQEMQRVVVAQCIPNLIPNNRDINRD